MSVLVPSSMSSASTKLTTINIAQISTSFGATTIIGENAGIFKHYGLQLNFNFVSSPPIGYAAVLSGTAQVAFASTGTLIPADMAGEGLKYISNVEVSSTNIPPFPNNADSLMVAAGSTITSPAQLVGKTLGLAVLVGGGALQAQIAVTTAGGDWSKVNKVQVPYANMPAEIANGTIAAAVENQPYLREAGQKQLVELDSTTPYTLTGYVASASYIASHKAIVNAFEEAQQQSILYTAAHLSKITPTILAEAAGLPASEASLFTVPGKINFSTNLFPQGILSYEKLMQTYGALAAGPLMPASAMTYTAPGTPMTKLLFNSAGKYIGKTTITCTKGKLTKKVTAVNPKCPAGYTLKK
jgi:NitT/TauT family transport system substrate-binding protein